MYLNEPFARKIRYSKNGESYHHDQMEQVLIDSGFALSLLNIENFDQLKSYLADHAWILLAVLQQDQLNVLIAFLTLMISQPQTNGRRQTLTIRTRTFLIVIALLGLVFLIVSNRIRRERRIERALHLIDAVPDNRYLADWNTDPTSVVRAANFLLLLNESEARDALSRYARMHSDRNNLGVLSRQLITDSPVSLSSTMRERDGLLFVVEFPPGSEIGCPNPCNLEIYESVLKNAAFKRSTIDLPSNPVITLKSILSGVGEVDKVFVIRQLVVASGGNFAAIREGCRSPEELIQKLFEIGLQLNHETSTYSIQKQ